MSKFRPDLMEPIAAWTRGAKFAEVSKMSSVFEVRHAAALGAAGVACSLLLPAASQPQRGVVAEGEAVRWGHHDVTCATSC